MSSPFIIGLQGDPTTWANPPAGKTAVGVNDSGQVVVKQSDGSIQTITTSAPGVHSQASSSGPVTVTPTTGIFQEILNLTGAARTVTIILATAGIVDGTQLTVTAILNAISGLNLDFRNGSGGGAQVASFDSGGEANGAWSFVMIAGTWNPTEAQVPAY